MGMSFLYGWSGSLQVATFGDALGSADPLDQAYMAELRSFVARHGTAWHSDHLCFSGHGGALLHDLLPLAKCVVGHG